MKKPRFPFTVTERGVSARIRKVHQNKDGKRYTLFLVDYHLLGKRKREARATFKDAEQVAKDACRLIAAGRQEALTLTNEDRMTYLRATEALSALGVKLDVAAREYADCLGLLAGRITLIEACRDWARRNTTPIAHKAVSDAVTDCLQAQASDGKSDVRRKHLGIIFKRFASDMKCQVSDVSPSIISKWLTELKGSERTKKNYRDGIGFFCRWCVMRGYLAKGTDWLENVQNYSARKLSEIEIYTPEELSRLLAVAGKMTPFIALAAFAGVRHAEIDRLDWRQVDLVDGFIEIPSIVSKTGERRLIPIHENLKAWLLPYRQDEGRIISYENTTKQLLRVAERADMPWKHNALRHSFISYRVAETADVPRVADEAGNSPAMIRQHYLRRVRPAQAAEWFAIRPGVIPFPLSQTHGDARPCAQTQDYAERSSTGDAAAICEGREVAGDSVRPGLSPLAPVAAPAAS